MERTQEHIIDDVPDFVLTAEGYRQLCRARDGFHALQQLGQTTHYHGFLNECRKEIESVLDKVRPRSTERSGGQSFLTQKSDVG